LSYARDPPIVASMDPLRVSSEHSAGPPSFLAIRLGTPPPELRNRLANSARLLATSTPRWYLGPSAGRLPATVGAAQERGANE